MAELVPSCAQGARVQPQSLWGGRGFAWLEVLALLSGEGCAGTRQRPLQDLPTGVQAGWRSTHTWEGSRASQAGAGEGQSQKQSRGGGAGRGGGFRRLG